jgi:hypothetical protein
VKEYFIAIFFVKKIIADGLSKSSDTEGVTKYKSQINIGHI